MGPVLGLNADGEEQPCGITEDGKLTVNATISSDTWGEDVLSALNKLANSPSVSWDQAREYASLPSPSTVSGETWLVLDGTGIWPVNKPSGWYYSDGNSWTYLGAYNPVVTGGNVVVTNFPSVQPVSGPLTNSQLRATAIPVSGDLSLSGSVAVSNFPATQPVSGSVAITNLPATQPVSGTVAVSGTVPVSGAFFQATQPVSAVTLPLPVGAATETTLALIKAKTDNLDVLLSTRTKPADSQTISGAVSVSNFPASQAVTGTFWPATQPVSGSVSVSNFPASQAVTGTFWQATQPVSGPLTDTQLRATAVPVSGTFFQATQPVSGTVAVSGSVAVTGPLTDTQLRASAVPVSGTFFQATQPVSGTVAVSNFPATQAVSGTVTSNQGGTWTVQPGNTANTTAWKVDGSAVTQPVSGTITVQQATAANLKIDLSGTAANATAIKVDGSAVTQPVSGTVTTNQVTLTKGAQGATGVSTQDLKDAGRSYLSFTANAIAGVTVEALVSFTQNKQGTNTTSVTSYTVTSGKTLRITSISVGLKSAAAAIAFAKVILRHNTAGATTASSPIAYLVPEINTNSALSGTGAFITIPIPDGLEFFGNGTQTIGVSHLDQATTNILNITVLGFEY